MPRTSIDRSDSATTAPAERQGLLDRLLHLHDTPQRTAIAFALGVFFSFSPFIGFQILASFALAFLFRLNRLAVFIGLNANLPWILVPWYAGTTIAAAYALGITIPAGFSDGLGALFDRSLFTREFWTYAWTLIEPLLMPFLIGPTIGAVPIAIAAYFVTAAVLRRRHREARA
jgi:uncharacterized protein (DUF2062 family)